jgi:hypothetical protein
MKLVRQFHCNKRHSLPTPDIIETIKKNRRMLVSQDKSSPLPNFSVEFFFFSFESNIVCGSVEVTVIKNIRVFLLVAICFAA